MDSSPLQTVLYHLQFSFSLLLCHLNQANHLEIHPLLSKLKSHLLVQVRGNSSVYYTSQARIKSFPDQLQINLILTLLLAAAAQLSFSKLIFSQLGLPQAIYLRIPVLFSSSLITKPFARSIIAATQDQVSKISVFFNLRTSTYKLLFFF